jgi:hypothetical protein
MNVANLEGSKRSGFSHEFVPICLSTGGLKGFDHSIHSSRSEDESAPAGSHSFGDRAPAGMDEHHWAALGNKTKNKESRKEAVVTKRLQKKAASKQRTSQHHE